MCGLLVSLVGAEALRGQVTVDGLAGHLTAAHCAYFKKWDAMMSLEEQQALAPRKEACSMPSAQREKQGNCSARMRVSRAVAGVEGGGGGRPCAELVVTFERFDSDGRFQRLFGWARRGLTDLGRTCSCCRPFFLLLRRRAVACGYHSAVSLTCESGCQRLRKATASRCGPRVSSLALCAKGWWRR